ncbi:hypothetical protein KC335_g118 [Hortaea werneckii]|nr:hypothetical protein KC335_g118 [Hortaea werneckii]
MDAVVEVSQLEGLPLLGVTQDLVGEELLEDLSMIDLLFDRAGGHETVDFHFPFLTQSPCTFARLDIGRGVPVRVVDDDAVGAVLAVLDRRVSVHTTVFKPWDTAYEAFENIEHDASACLFPSKIDFISSELRNHS